MEWNHVVRIDHRNYFSEVRLGWTLNRFNILEAVLIRWSYFSQLDYCRPPNAFSLAINYQITVFMNKSLVFYYVVIFLKIPLKPFRLSFFMRGRDQHGLTTVNWAICDRRVPSLSDGNICLQSIKAPKSNKFK